MPSDAESDGTMDDGKSLDKAVPQPQSFSGPPHPPKGNVLKKLRS